MKCKNCGAEISPGDLFCEKCGARAEAAAAAPSEDDLPTVMDGSGGRVPEERFIEKPTGDDLASQNALLQQIWPEWRLIDKLGEGSFGKVYKAERSEMGATFYSAIKIITVPQNSSEIETVRAEIGSDDMSTTSYFRALVNDCVNEVKMMESFKGTQNIVSVEDYKVVSHKDTLGWTIFIRMELLTGFTSYCKNRTLSEKEVIKLGIDICNALEFCAKLDVMHRDIKPENIFISRFGDFKLGDFGIARKLEKSTSGMSRKGTYNYMAPEVFNGNGQYDFTSDIYSLGIVLYRLLNNNRFPLVDPRSDSVTYQQLQDAVDQRLAGAKLPKPLNASDALSSVILTACSYNPLDRFSSAKAMKAALMNVQNGTADRVASRTSTGTSSRAAVPAQSRTAVSTPSRNVMPLDQTAVATPGKHVAPPPPPPPVSPERDRSNDTVALGPKKPEKPKKEKKKMSKGKKALAIILSILIVILGAGGYVGYKYLTGSERKIMKALDDEDYDGAVDIYKTDMNGDASSQLISSLETRLDKVKEDFSAGTIEYSVANMEVATIEKMEIADIADKLKEVKDFISDLNASRTAFSTAESMFAKEDYVGAIENYKKVIESDSNYESAKTKLATATQNYRDQVVKKAADYVAEGNYAKAIAELEAALKVIPDDATITGKIEVYEKEMKEQSKNDAITSAKASADSGDYESAIKTLAAAMKKFPDDVDITTDYNAYVEKYVDSILAQVDENTAAKNYVAAIELLNNALKVLPDNETLKETLATVKENQPVSLATLTPINGGWDNWNDGTPTDPFGVTHTQLSNYLILSGGHSGSAGESYAEYRLYGKYSTLTGSLISHADIAENGYSQVKIYADDQLVYPSPNIERKTDKVDFSANIQGADYIKIEVVCDKGDNGWNSDYAQCLILMDMQLWKE